ncbi:hypothetical protein JXR01_01545 [Candidatus Kaiserbacteria bacterium]|nr:MAG: hypothetical protein JXR01_01545 [Candidatus Kaiserbacteria bacterium]
MFKMRSVAGRIFIGVLIGLVVGIVAILALPTFGFSLFSMFGFGTLLVFILMGLTLGLVGMFDTHPIFGFTMRWWIRGAVAGFLFTLMYILLGYSSLEVVMESNVVAWMGLSSPFWVLIDGTLIGLFMGWMETKFAGEGSSLPLT